MSLPTLADGPPPATRSPPAAVAEEVRLQIQHLDSNDPKVVARAVAAVFMLATKTECHSQLMTCVPRLVSLVRDPDNLCRRNAIAALTSIMVSSSSEAQEQLVSCGEASNRLAEGLVSALTEDDPLLRLNAASALGAFAQVEGGVHAVDDAGGAAALLKMMESETDVRVVEAEADTVCAIATHDGQRDSLRQQGAVEALAALLSSTSPEIRVRALLGLGMLVGSNGDAQWRLAMVDGAVGNILSLIRRGDPDERLIARDLYAALACNKTLRPVLEAHLRQQQQQLMEGQQ